MYFLKYTYLLLAPHREHGKVFEKVPIVGFRRAKSLKDLLVIFRGTRCEICKHVVTTETFRSFSTQRDYCIKPDNLNCCSSNVVYHFSCKACSKRCIGSTESFRSRFNNCKSVHRSFIKGNTIKQVSFHTHFEDDKRHGISDWETTLIDQVDSVDNLRRIDSFWLYELDTFQPYGLNDHDVACF